MGYTTRACRAEYRQTGCAFGEIENHRREAGNRSERHADQDDSECLEGDRHRRKEERDGDMCTGGNEERCSD